MLTVKYVTDLSAITGKMTSLAFIISNSYDVTKTKNNKKHKKKNPTPRNSKFKISPTGTSIPSRPITTRLHRLISERGAPGKKDFPADSEKTWVFLSLTHDHSAEGEVHRSSPCYIGRLPYTRDAGSCLLRLGNCCGSRSGALLWVEVCCCCHYHLYEYCYH